MKKILTALTFLLISTLFFACSDSKNEPGPDPIGKATLEVTATLDLKATEKLPTRAGEVTLADLTYVITNTGTKKEVNKGEVPADGKLKKLTLEAGTYSVAITSSPAGMPKPAFDTPIYGRTETVVLKGGDVKKLPVKSTQQNAGVNFTFADFAGVAVVAKIVHADGTLTYAANDDKKIGYFGPAAVEASFTVDGVAIKVNGKDKETLTLKAGELWKIKLSKTAASGAWVLSNTDPDPVTGELLEGDGFGDYYGGTTATQLLLDLYSADDKLNMYLHVFTTPTTFANVGLAEGEYDMAPRGQSSYAPMTFIQGAIVDKSVAASCFFGYDTEGLLADFWIPSSSGKIVVSKAGDIYTITATFSGTHYIKEGDTNNPFTDLTWTFKGKITWTDKSTPSEGGVMDDIKAGAWNAAGTGGITETPGPNNFALTLAKKTNLLEFMGWAGDASLPMWLYVNNNKFTLDPTKDLAPQFSGFENNQIFFRPFALVDGGLVWDTKTLFPATFDKTAQTLKLSATFTVEGNPVDVHFGYIVLDKAGGSIEGFLGDAYKNLTLTGSATRAGMSVSYSDKISAEELNALLSSGKMEMVNLPVDVKVETPLMKRYVSPYDVFLR